jgi:hypothetical protein
MARIPLATGLGGGEVVVVLGLGAGGVVVVILGAGLAVEVIDVGVGVEGTVVGVAVVVVGFNGYSLRYSRSVRCSSICSSTVVSGAPDATAAAALVGVCRDATTNRLPTIVTIAMMIMKIRNRVGL